MATHSSFWLKNIFMFQQPLKFLSKILLGWRAKKRRQTEMIDVTTQFTRIKNGVILLPENATSLPVALEKYDELRRLLKETAFEFIYLKNTSFDFSPEIAKKIKFVEKQDVTFFGAPTKAFMQTYTDRPFDLLIDLNDDFEVFATFFASICEAKLRVCLSNPHREAFYNFQVNPFGAKTLTNKYDVLLKYLAKAISPVKKPTTFQPV